MMHDFKNDPEGLDRHCQQCGASYHCSLCRDGCGILGHCAQDDGGNFYHCQDKPRYDRHLELVTFKRDQMDRAHYEKLKARFEGA